VLNVNEMSLADLVLECVPRTCFVEEAAFWHKYEQLCKRHGLLALPMQAKAALRRLKEEGRITFAKGKGIKKV
jgi:hypothetical protein